MNIFEAIKHNNIEKVKELINSGIDVNIRKEDGSWTPLIYSIFRYFSKENTLEIIQLLLEQPKIDVMVSVDKHNTLILKTLGYLISYEPKFFFLFSYIISHKSFDIKKYLIGEEKGFSIFMYRLDKFRNSIDMIEDNILNKVKIKMDLY